jgi:hypothetical protein
MMDFMGTMMLAVVCGGVTPSAANAACNAADKMIRTAKLFSGKKVTSDTQFLDG